MATRELVKVTGKSIAAFYERMAVGVSVECLENTYIPARAGMIGTINRPGKTSMGVSCGDNHGYRMSRPQRVSDVLELTDNTITYRMAEREGHTVTWRIVP